MMNDTHSKRIDPNLLIMLSKFGKFLYKSNNNNDDDDDDDDDDDIHNHNDNNNDST